AGDGELDGAALAQTNGVFVRAGLFYFGMGPSPLEGPGMNSRVSAGLVLYRKRDGQLEVFLAHPGGPFFARKDEGHWTIPKGEVESGEDMLATAIRELKEETGLA